MRTTADFVRLLTAIRDHLAAFEPAGEIAAVEVTEHAHSARITVQLGCVYHLVPVARGLLSWAYGLAQPEVTVWRVPDGGSVHIAVHGRLVDEPVTVYAGAPFNAETFGSDLEPGGRHGVSLGVLRAWAGESGVAA